MDVKKRPWNKAILAAANIVHFQDHVRKEILRNNTTATNNNPPPIAERIVATAMEDTPLSSC